MRKNISYNIWKDWISVYNLDNYILNDPFLDWVNMYGFKN